MSSEIGSSEVYSYTHIARMVRNDGRALIHSTVYYVISKLPVGAICLSELPALKHSSRVPSVQHPLPDHLPMR
jgi:hypothetical protein